MFENLSGTTADRERIVEAGGVEAVIQALLAYPMDERVQQPGCRAIAKISKSSSSHARIVEAGGVEVGAAVKAVGDEPITHDLSLEGLLQKVGEAKQESAKFTITFGPAGSTP